MRAVNLLPREAIREPRKIPSTLPLVAALTVPLVAGALVIIGYSGAHSALAVKRAQLAALRAHAAPVATAVSPATVSAAAGLVDQRTQRLAALRLALGKQLPWDVTLRDVARVLPADVWLTSLGATSPSPADAVTAPAPVASTTTTPAPPAQPSSSGAGFTMGGYAFTEDDVALLLRRLQLLPSLGNVTLVSTTSQTETGSKPLVQFQLTAVIEPASSGSAQ
jgi:Tfp pilus assembly protein PilN